MELVIDVGNSETVFGIVDPGTLDLRNHWRLSTPVPRTPDEYGLLLRSLLRDGGISHDDLTMAVVGSVVPSATRILTDTLEQIVGEAPIVVDARSPLPIRLDVDEPLTVGADRIVNTLAAKEMYGRDTIAVDFGTATTFDCISENGEYMGGCIFPGIHISMDALFERTSKLHRVEIAKPKSVIGKTTTGALQSGLLYGYAGLVDSMVERIRTELGGPANVIATGGLAGRIARESRVIERVEPFLTLQGLRILFEKNRPERSRRAD